MNLGNYVGLKFILDHHAGFISAIVLQSYATDLISRWLNKTLPDRIGETNSSSPLGSGGWAVDTQYIRAIHTFSLEQQQQVPGNNPQMTSTIPNVSGRRY